MQQHDLDKQDLVDTIINEIEQSIISKKQLSHQQRFLKRIQTSQKEQTFMKINEFISNSAIDNQYKKKSQVVLSMVQNACDFLHNKTKSIKIKINKVIDIWFGRTLALAFSLKYAATRNSQFEQALIEFEIQTDFWNYIDQLEDWDQQKIDTTHFYQRIQDASIQKLFIGLPHQESNQRLSTLQHIIDQYYFGKRKISIKINKSLNQWSTQIFDLALVIRTARSQDQIQQTYQKLYVKADFWQYLHLLENSNQNPIGKLKKEFDQTHFNQRILDASQQQLFANINKGIQTLTRLSDEQKLIAHKTLNHLQTAMDEFTYQIRDINIKINSALNRWSTQTFDLTLDLSHSAQRIAQLKTFGGSDELKSFSEILDKLRLKADFWHHLHDLESIEPSFDKAEMRLIIQKLMPTQKLQQEEKQQKVIKKEVQAYNYIPTQQDSKIRKDVLCQTNPEPITKIVQERQYLQKQDTKILKDAYCQTIIEQTQRVVQEIPKQIIQSGNNQMQIAHELIYGITRNQDLKAGIKIYEQQQAYLCLGQLYSEGKLVTQDIPKAINYLKQGQNQVECIYQLAKLEEDKVQKKQLLQKASQMGHKEATIDICELMLSENQRDKALEILQKHIDHPRAMVLVAKYSNYSQAQALLQKAISNGYTLANYDLGMLYEEHEVTDLAVRYFKEGSLQDDIRCTEKLLPRLYEEAMMNNQMEEFEQYLRNILQQQESADCLYYLGLVTRDEDCQLKATSMGSQYFCSPRQLDYDQILDVLLGRDLD